MSYETCLTIALGGTKFNIPVSEDVVSACQTIAGVKCMIAHDFINVYPARNLVCRVAIVISL